MNKRLQKKGKRMSHNDIRKEQGVTLVALIIAVIILVILGSISIVAIYKSKIVEHEINAVLEYTGQSINENQIINKTEELIDSGVNKIVGILDDEDEKNNGFVALFNEIYNNSTTSERYITVEEVNSHYADLDDKTVTINEPGEYIAFATVGRSSKEGYTTYGYIRINGNIVENNGTVYSTSDNYDLSGMRSYSFSVEKNNPLTITYSISSNSAYGRYTAGSLLVVKRENKDTQFKDGLVAVFDANYRTSSKSEISTSIIDYNKDYAESNGTILTIKEPGDYSVFASVGRSSPYGWSTMGRLRINGNIVNNMDGVEALCWACPNGYQITKTYKHTLTVKEGETLSMNYNLYTDGAWDGRNCGSLIVVKNS